MSKRFNHELQSAKEVLLCVIIQNVHQCNGHCLISLNTRDERLILYLIEPIVCFKPPTDIFVCVFVCDLCVFLCVCVCVFSVCMCVCVGIIISPIRPENQQREIEKENARYDHRETEKENARYDHREKEKENARYDHREKEKETNREKRGTVNEKYFLSYWKKNQEKKVKCMDF